MKIGIVDIGINNSFKLSLAIKGLADVCYIKNPSDFTQVDSVILPGVGSFKTTMELLKSSELKEPLLNYISNGKKILGICVGMQVLFEQGHEGSLHPGLSLIKGEVLKLSLGEKSHTGFDHLQSEDSNFLKLAFFNHTYVCLPRDPSIVTSTCQLNHSLICASIRYKNITGTQFHPELSGKEGKIFLQDWLIS